MNTTTKTINMPSIRSWRSEDSFSVLKLSMELTLGLTLGLTLELVGGVEWKYVSPYGRPQRTMTRDKGLSFGYINRIGPHIHAKCQMLCYVFCN